MIVFVALLGWALGLLVNLLSDSLPYFRRPRRFQCHSCSSPRPIAAWSGILGTIFGKRTCFHCNTARPWRAVMVELFLIAGALYIYLFDPALENFLPSLIILTIFLLITVIDIEHRLILHIVSFPSAIIIGLMSVFDPARGASKTLLGGLGGFVIFLVLYYLGQLFAAVMSRLRGSQIDEVAFGFGDVTLAGVIGLTVGWPGVLPALVLGIIAAGLFSFLFILGMMLRKNYNPFMPIPYGPFLVFGCLITYFGGKGLFTALITP